MMENKNIYLSSAYLAPVQYYALLLADGDVYIDGYERYVKQSYRNRCLIMDAAGPMALTMPVEKNNRATTKDTLISDHTDWQHTHWNAILSSYNSSPFFEYYKDDFHPFYHKKYKFLFDFNESLREMVLKLLNAEDQKITYTEAYKSDVMENEIDLRNNISPKLDWQTSFTPESYYQVFGQKWGFTPNMSIIDLLFNMGNEGILVLKKSKIEVQ